MSDTTQKIKKLKDEEQAAVPVVETAEAPRWYRVHFLRNQKGPGKVVTRIGSGMARFKASQTDKEAEDFPTKILRLTAEQAAEFEKNPAFVIQNSAPPEPKGLGKKLVSRTISPETKPAGETKVEEGGS